MASRWIPRIGSSGIPGSGPPPPGEIDYFAPKYLVGNVVDGDSAVAHSAGGFHYIPDVGDGTGIQAALALAAIDTGDVWLRPGLYNYALGAITGALTVPASVRLRGAGGSTRIQTRAVGNQGAFVLAVGAEVADMTITAPAGSGAAGTERGLVAVAADLAFLRRISFQTSPSAGHGLRYCISVQAGGGGTVRNVRLEDIECNTTTIVSSADPTGALEVVPAAGSCIISFEKFRSLGGDVAMLDASIAGNGINQLIGEQLTLDQWTSAAIRWNGVGQIISLNMTTDGPTAAARAVIIATRPAVPATVLRDVWLDPKGAIKAGVAFAADVNGSVGLNPVLDGLTYSGAASCETLVLVNAAAARGVAISRVSVIAGVTLQAIDIGASNPDAVVDRCTIAMLGTSAHIGIQSTSTRTRIQNSTVELLVSGAGGVGTAIKFAAGGTEGIASNNNIVTVNAADVGIDLTGNNNGNVVGNILDMATDANNIVNVPVTCNVAQNVTV